MLLSVGHTLRPLTLSSRVLKKTLVTNAMIANTMLLKTAELVCESKRMAWISFRVVDISCCNWPDGLVGSWGYVGAVRGL